MKSETEQRSEILPARPGLSFDALLGELAGYGIWALLILGFLWWVWGVMNGRG